MALNQLPDLSKYTALLIDDIPEMRSASRIQLTDIGIQQCESARNIKEAIERISEKRYDLILSDYNLGQGADGQQLLELLRRRNLLPLTTVYLLITGETGYEQVSTAAEYAPDDYLIKPYTSHILHTRLARIVEKKLALRPVYLQLAEGGNKLKALEACNALLAANSRYVLDLTKIKGELLLELKRYDEALALYQELLTVRSTPWAEVGKARSLIANGQEEAAQAHLAKTLDAYPNYLAAYDLQAGLLEKTDKVAAQQLVEKALKVAPSTQRQRQVGSLALANKDFSRAEEAFKKAVEKDKTGFFKSHDDYSGLAKSRMEQGKTTEALATLKEMGQSFRASPELSVRQASMESLVHTKAGHADAAKAALKKALDAGGASTDLDPNVALELAGACLAAGDDEHAKAIIQNVAADFQDDSAMLARVQSVFVEAGREEEGVALIEQTRKQMIALNNDAVALAQAGELDKAAAMLDEAADRLHNNAQVALNAAILAMRRIQQQGVSDELIAKAHRYISQAKRVNPVIPRLDDAIRLYTKLAPPDAPALAPNSPPKT